MVGTGGRHKVAKPKLVNAVNWAVSRLCTSVPFPAGE